MQARVLLCAEGEHQRSREGARVEASSAPLGCLERVWQHVPRSTEKRGPEQDLATKWGQCAGAWDKGLHVQKPGPAQHSSSLPSGS